MNLPDDYPSDISATWPTRQHFNLELVLHLQLLWNCRCLVGKCALIYYYFLSYSSSLLEPFAWLRRGKYTSLNEYQRASATARGCLLHSSSDNHYVPGTRSLKLKFRNQHFPNFSNHDHQKLSFVKSCLSLRHYQHDFDLRCLIMCNFAMFSSSPAGDVTKYRAVSGSDYTCRTHWLFWSIDHVCS